MSRSKVLELIQKKFLGQDDELCAGNGYWFFVRENAFVNRFLINEEPQPFNPVSEAKEPGAHTGKVAVSEDADAPDITLVLKKPDKDEIVFDKIEHFGHQDHAKKEAPTKASDEPGKLPEQNDLEYPDLNHAKFTPPKEQEVARPKMVDIPPVATVKPGTTEKKSIPKGNDRFLIYLAGVITFVLLLSLVGYYNKIIKRPPPNAILIDTKTSP